VARAALPGRHAARAPRQVPGAQPLRRPGARADRGGEHRYRRCRALSSHRRPLVDADPGARATLASRVRRGSGAIAGGSSGAGSGKTGVALYAMLRAVEHDLQAALMAPTESLAEQHFATIESLLPGELVRAGLLTGSTPGRRRTDLLSKLATGELSLIVGTHV